MKYFFVTKKNSKDLLAISVIKDEIMVGHMNITELLSMVGVLTDCCATS